MSPTADDACPAIEVTGAAEPGKPHARAFHSSFSLTSGSLRLVAGERVTDRTAQYEGKERTETLPRV